MTFDSPVVGGGIRTVFQWFLAFIITSGPLFNQEVSAASGTNSFEFLRLSPEARASGLSEVVVANTQGTEAVFFNPSGLPATRGSELEAQHLSYVSDVSYDYASFARGDGRRGWGVNLGYLRVGNFTRTVYDPTSVDRFDETGDIPVHDLLFSVGYGYSPSVLWDFGLAAKFFQETLDASTVNGGALDIGGIYHFDPQWSLGASVRDIGPSLRFAGAEARLPWTGDVGLWNKLNAWLGWGAEVSETIDEPIELRAGGEAIPESHIALRAGYALRSESNDLGMLANASFGMGLLIGPAHLDYAFGSLGDFGYTHRISMAWRFTETPLK